MQPMSGSSDIGDALLVASRVLVGVAARSLADIDVTLPQFRALVVVSSRPGTTMSDLAQALDVHSTTATRLCDRLVDKDLITRDHSTEDRRATEIRLTPSGRRLVSRVSQRRRRDLAAIAAKMPSQAALAAVAALSAFAEAAGESGSGIDPFGWDDSASAP